MSVRPPDLSQSCTIYELFENTTSLKRPLCCVSWTSVECRQRPLNEYLFTSVSADWVSDVLCTHWMSVHYCLCSLNECPLSSMFAKWVSIIVYVRWMSVHYLLCPLNYVRWMSVHYRLCPLNECPLLSMSVECVPSVLCVHWMSVQCLLCRWIPLVFQPPFESHLSTKDTLWLCPVDASD